MEQEEGARAVRAALSPEGVELQESRQLSPPMVAKAQEPAIGGGSLGQGAVDCAPVAPLVVAELMVAQQPASAGRLPARSYPRPPNAVANLGEDKSCGG